MARFLGIGKESSYATPVAPTVFLEAESEGIQDEPLTEAIETIRSRSVRQQEILTSAVRGPAQVVANYQDLHALFFSLIGSESTAAGPPIVHTQPDPAVGYAARPSLTVEATRDGSAGSQAWRYAGMFLTGLQLAVAVDSLMRASLAFTGKEEAVGTEASPTWPDLDLVLPKHCTMTVDAVSVPASRFSLNCQAPVSEPHVLGSTRFGSTPTDSAGMSVLGEADVIFENMTTYNKFAANTHVPIVLTCASGGDEAMVLTLQDVLLTAYTPHLDGRNQLVAPVRWAGQYDSLANDILKAVITNDASAF